MFTDVANKSCSTELLAKIADVVDSPIIISQKGPIGAYDHKIIYANKAFRELSGYSDREIIGRSPDLLCDQRNNPEGMLEFYQNCHFKEGFESILQSFSRDGSGYSAKLQVTPAGQDEQERSHFIITFSEIEYEQEIELDDDFEDEFTSEAYEAQEYDIAEDIEEEVQQEVVIAAAQPQEWQQVSADAADVEINEETPKIAENAENNNGYDSILEEIAAELSKSPENDDFSEEEDEIAVDIFEDDEDDLKEEYKLVEAPVAKEVVIEEVAEEDSSPLDKKFAGDAEEFFSQLGAMLDTDQPNQPSSIQEIAEQELAGQDNKIEAQEIEAETTEAIQEDEVQEAVAELSSATGQIAELLKSIEKKKSEAEHNNVAVERVRDESPEPEAVEGELNYYAKNRFMSNMSHDLRTPLNAIIGFSEVIRDQLFGPIDNPRYTSYANDIYKSGQELLATVSEILELSEIEEEDTTLEEEDFSLTDTLNEILDLLSARAFQCDVKIMKKLHAEDIKCKGDRKKIKQAFAGIISNAIKSSPTGGNLELHSEINEDGAFELMVYIKSANMIAAKSNLGSLLGTVTSKIESEYPEIMIAHKFIELHGGEFSIFNSATSGTEISMILPEDRVSRETSNKEYLKVIASGTK